MTLFQNKYRIESARRQGWDYADNGYYFITICTKDREHFFGEFENGEMVLSEMGLVVKNEIDITRKRKNLIIEEFVIMPNHIHLLLQLFENESRRRRDVARNVSTTTDMITTTITEQSNIFDKDDFMSEISPRANSISVIIRALKSAISRQIHEIGHNNFQWQPRFHDRILRDEIELYNVRNYITNNPRNWEDDEFYT